MSQSNSLPSCSIVISFLPFDTTDTDGNVSRAAFTIRRCVCVCVVLVVCVNVARENGVLERSSTGCRNKIIIKCLLTIIKRRGGPLERNANRKKHAFVRHLKGMGVGDGNDVVINVFLTDCPAAVRRVTAD